MVSANEVRAARFPSLAASLTVPCTLGGSAIGRALQQNCTLLELDLHGNPLGDTGSHALAAALVENTQLRALGLSRTGTTDVGCAELACAVSLPPDQRRARQRKAPACGPDRAASLRRGSRGARLTLRASGAGCAVCRDRQGGQGVESQGTHSRCEPQRLSQTVLQRPSALEFAIPSRTVGVLRGFVHTGRRWVAPGNRTLQMLDLSQCVARATPPPPSASARANAGCSCALRSNPLGAQGVLALLGGLAEFQQSLGRAREQAAEAEAFEQENARALEAARKAAAPRSPRTGAQQQQQPRRQQDLSGLPEAERALLTRAALLRQRCDDAVAEAAGRAPIVLSLLQLQSVAPLPVTLHDGSFVALAQRALPHAAQARSAATAPDATAAASAAAAISALAQEAADAETPPLLSLPPDTEAPGVEAGRSSGRSAANSRRASVGRAPLRPDAFALAASALNSCTRRRLPEDHYAALPTGWPVREGTEGSPLTIPVSEDTLRMCALAQQLARDFAITVEL